MQKIAFLGHRPHRLFPGSANPYGTVEYRLLKEFCAQCLDRLRQTLTIEAVLTGMALGVDQAGAEAAMDLGIPVEAYLPFASMDAKWPARARQKFQELSARCQSVHTVGKGGYSAALLYKRNEAMLAGATCAAVLWDGREGGGTWHSIQLLRRSHKPYWNFWAEWLEVWSSHLAGTRKQTVTGLPPLEKY